MVEMEWFYKKWHDKFKNAKWKDDFSPLDPDGTSYVDKAYTKAYVRHLTVSNELLAGQLLVFKLAFYGGW